MTLYVDPSRALLPLVNQSLPQDQAQGAAAECIALPPDAYVAAFPPTGAGAVPKEARWPDTPKEWTFLLPDGVRGTGLYRDLLARRGLEEQPEKAFGEFGWERFLLYEFLRILAPRQPKGDFPSVSVISPSIGDNRGWGEWSKAYQAADPMALLWSLVEVERSIRHGGTLEDAYYDVADRFLKKSDLYHRAVTLSLLAIHHQKLYDQKYYRYPNDHFSEDREARLREVHRLLDEAARLFAGEGEPLLAAAALRFGASRDIRYGETHNKLNARVDLADYLVAAAKAAGEGGKAEDAAVLARAAWEFIYGGIFGPRYERPEDAKELGDAVEIIRKSGVAARVIAAMPDEGDRVAAVRDVFNLAATFTAGLSAKGAVVSRIHALALELADELGQADPRRASLRLWLGWHLLEAAERLEAAQDEKRFVAGLLAEEGMAGDTLPMRARAAALDHAARVYFGVGAYDMAAWARAELATILPNVGDSGAADGVPAVQLLGAAQLMKLTGDALHGAAMSMTEATRSGEEDLRADKLNIAMQLTHDAALQYAAAAAAGVPAWMDAELAVSAGVLRLTQGFLHSAMGDEGGGAIRSAEAAMEHFLKGGAWERAAAMANEVLRQIEQGLRLEGADRGWKSSARVTAAGAVTTLRGAGVLAHLAGRHDAVFDLAGRAQWGAGIIKDLGGGMEETDADLSAAVLYAMGDDPGAAEATRAKARSASEELRRGLLESSRLDLGTETGFRVWLFRELMALEAIQSRGQKSDALERLILDVSTYGHSDLAGPKRARMALRAMRESGTLDWLSPPVGEIGPFAGGWASTLAMLFAPVDYAGTLALIARDAQSRAAEYAVRHQGEIAMSHRDVKGQKWRDELRRRFGEMIREGKRKAK